MLNTHLNLFMLNIFEAALEREERVGGACGIEVTEEIRKKFPGKKEKKEKNEVRRLGGCEGAKTTWAPPGEP